MELKELPKTQKQLRKAIAAVEKSNLTKQQKDATIFTLHSVVKTAIKETEVKSVEKRYGLVQAFIHFKVLPLFIDKEK